LSQEQLLNVMKTILLAISKFVIWDTQRSMRWGAGQLSAA